MLLQKCKSYTSYFENALKISIIVCLTAGTKVAIRIINNNTKKAYASGGTLALSLYINFLFILSNIVF